MSIYRQTKKICSGLLVLLLVHSSFSHAKVNREYKIKAAILFNFTKFTHWPAYSFADDNSHIQVCVLEPNPFNSFLTQLAENKKVGKQQRSVAISTIAQLDEHSIKRCHVLFISEINSLPVRIPSHLLLISENKDIRAPLIHINMELDNNQIRLEANLENLSNSEIKISSQLLKLARRTYGELRE